MEIQCAFFLCCALTVSSAVVSPDSASPVSVEKHSVDVNASGDLLFEKDAVSVVMCAAMCIATPDCRTMAFTTGSPSSFCRGYAPLTTHVTTTTTNTIAISPRTAAWTVLESSWLEKQCINHTDCGGPLRECIARSCLCTVGYYYSLTRDTCVDSCQQQSLRQQLLAYPGKRIERNNLVVGRYLTWRGCLELFEETPDARTVDYIDHGSVTFCAVQAVTWLDVASVDLSDDPSSIHYQKTCV